MTRALQFSARGLTHLCVISLSSRVVWTFFLRGSWFQEGHCKRTGPDEQTLTKPLLESHLLMSKALDEYNISVYYSDGAAQGLTDQETQSTGGCQCNSLS